MSSYMLSGRILLVLVPIRIKIGRFALCLSMYMVPARMLLVLNVPVIKYCTVECYSLYFGHINTANALLFSPNYLVCFIKFFHESISVKSRTLYVTKLLVLL